MGWTVLFYGGPPIYDEEEEQSLSDFVFSIYDTEPEDKIYQVFDTKVDNTANFCGLDKAFDKIHLNDDKCYISHNNYYFFNN